MKLNRAYLIPVGLSVAMITLFFVFQNGTLIRGSKIEVRPSKTKVVIGRTIQFEANGGTEPYQFFLVSGGGFIDPNSGVYTASMIAETEVKVEVQDAAGLTAQSTISVIAPTPTRVASEFKKK